MALTWQCICVDCEDPKTLGAWWAEFLGWRITHETDEETVLEPPEGSPQDGVSPDILFLKVPEGKAVKNRLHLDLRPDDQAAEIARAERMGATRVDVGQEGGSWTVMADPVGNEFCVLRAFTPEELASFAASEQG
ncbi:VOC family protein [Salininema proteolyticum]|uniref:VOC family protein n=1 Tax=Salininema proteolyticum TaxID=1607685 RepID=A0ABV8TX95_9ACTN